MKKPLLFLISILISISLSAQQKKKAEPSKSTFEVKFGDFNGVRSITKEELLKMLNAPLRPRITPLDKKQKVTSFAFSRSPHVGNSGSSYWEIANGDTLSPRMLEIIRSCGSGDIIFIEKITIVDLAQRSRHADNSFYFVIR